MDQISFTILLHTAASLVTTAAGILPGPDSPPDLAGAIGRAAPAALLPARHRARFKARTTKNSTSKYGPNTGQHPATTQDYTVHVQVTYFTEGVAPRPDR